MGCHFVKITETRTRIVSKNTDYDFEALHEVEQDYAKCKINLDDDCFLADFKIELVEEE